MSSHFFSAVLKAVYDDRADFSPFARYGSLFPR
jgi:hypothetical protein